MLHHFCWYKLTAYSWFLTRHLNVTYLTVSAYIGAMANIKQKILQETGF